MCLVVVEAEVSDVLFRVRSICTSLFLFLLPHLSGLQAYGALLRSCSFRVFDTVWPQFSHFWFRLTPTDAQLSTTIL